MSGRTWKEIAEADSEHIKGKLIDSGGIERQAKGEYEKWAIRYSDANFTYYTKGTLYCTPSKSNDPAVEQQWKYIDQLLGSVYEKPTKEFLVGLDETGKGELFGHTILAGAIIPKKIFEEIDHIIGPADTKKRHSQDYWDDLLKHLDQFRSSGFNFIIEKITPWHIDRYNLNKILDVSYQRIISILLRKIKFDEVRIVIDDYGIGPTLQRFLNFLTKLNCEVITTTKAEDSYLEAKTASLLSKQVSQSINRAINTNENYQINQLSIGSGNASDPQTKKWIEEWHKSRKPWPWFVKKSFKTIRNIENKEGKAFKIVPPIREDLLTEEFVNSFNEGRLSIKALSLICPECGHILKSISMAIFKQNGKYVSRLKCPEDKCKNFIDDASLTLRYFCGYIVPDSNAIFRSMLSNDLKASKLFEDFSVIICPVVRKECDGTNRGKKEFQELKKYHSIGRIKLESPGKIEDVPDNLSNAVRDERIIQTCLDYNAILLTADKSMSAFSAGKEVFTISV